MAIDDIDIDIDIDTADAEELREACRSLQAEVKWLDREIAKRIATNASAGIDYGEAGGDEGFLVIADRALAEKWFAEALAEEQ